TVDSRRSVQAHVSLDKTRSGNNIKGWLTIHGSVLRALAYGVRQPRHDQTTNLARSRGFFS
ncbi:MAG: hypothetical protein ABI604_08870, partial [Nitrospirota bacterium]